MRTKSILVSATLVLLMGGLACKSPKTPEQIQQESQAACGEGGQAFKEGKPRDANPYLKDKKDAHKATAWTECWDKAKAEKDAADKAAQDKLNEGKKTDDDAARKAAEAEAARKAAEEAKLAAMRQAAEAALKEINFDFDRSDIRNADKPKLQGIADFLKNYGEIKLQVEGHCDERGTVEYNLALGERRANSAKNYLVGLGVADARLSTISYGKERPKVQGKDEESWLANRRAEFKLH